MTREDRVQELRELSHSNPQRLIAIYRDAMGMDELSQLPAGASFTSMIDAIIEQESKSRKVEREPPASID